jgi:F-type H+-transporting ATPase subunit epsilon
MHLKVLLPYQVFADKTDVLGIIVDSTQGSLGLLPHRLDCAAVLVPGILSYETKADGTVYLAVAGGALVKTGDDVLVSVRNAIGGTDLKSLQEAVKRDFLKVDEEELSARAAMARMESGFIRRFAEFKDG